MTPLDAYNTKRKMLPLPPRRSQETSAKMPSLATRAKHAVVAVGRVIEAAVEGKLVIVDDTERGRRIELCKACEWWRPSAYGVTGGCGHGQCGCSSLKLRMGTERCPIERW